jgi:prolyl-tRNA synthetase
MVSDRGYVEELADVEDDFDRWYVEVVRKAEMADDSPVRGTRIIRPYGYALWENIQRQLDDRIKATGVENAYFPLFIPKSMLEREADHVEGFAPEVAWVTHGGDKKLEEPWAVRPTSEAIICPIYARWVQSYRDLPILINQWANVVRWEERPRAFLRTVEFLWQEGHTAHASLDEAEERTLQMLDVYRDLCETELAIPVIPGLKSDSEKFAGALRTYTIEAMMGGKHWALQSGTSHNLGDHFGRVFDIDFLDANGERHFAFNTSWGLSTRIVGAVIMVHGDERGLRMPPRVAPTQAVIVPIWRKNKEKEAVEQAVKSVQDSMGRDIRVKVDLRDDKTPGWKFNEWELKGVPVRIELGPRDIQNEQVMVVRRDTGEKQPVPMTELPEMLPKLLEEIQENMYAQAQAMLAEKSERVTSYDRLRERVGANAGFSYAFWCGKSECEDKVKSETHATIRCIPFDQPSEGGSCVVCGSHADTEVVFARAY